VVEPAKEAGFPAETFGEGWVGRKGMRQELQRHEAVEPRLTGLVNRPHPTGADEFENLQLKEGGGDGFEGWRRNASLGGLARFGGGGDGSQEAFGAKPLRGTGRQRRLTFRTAIGNWFIIHTASFLRKPLAEVTQNRVFLAITVFFPMNSLDHLAFSMPGGRCLASAELCFHFVTES
jgi:hypothetical protein